MSEGPILAAMRTFMGLGVNRHYTAALEGTNVRHSLFIQHQIPSNNAPRPVPQYFAERVRPFGPIRLVIGTGVIRPTFCPVSVLRGEGLMDSRHGVRSAGIAVPCNPIHVFADFRIAQFIDSSAPKIVIVVEYPNPGVERCL